MFFGSGAYAGIRTFNDEGGELFAIDFGEDGEESGSASVGDPVLLAVENVVRAFGVEDGFCFCG